MNQTDSEKKSALMKVLAIVGLLAVLIFGAWLAVKVVALVPTAFTSLASLADGVYNYEEVEASDISIQLSESVVASGELTEINWSNANQDGSYYFAYECVDGVSLSAVLEGGETVLTCDELVEVPLSPLSLRIESEKQRFTDLPLSVLFVGDTATETDDTAVITIVNDSIDADPVPEVELSGDNEDAAADTDDAISSEDDEDSADDGTSTGNDAVAPVTPAPEYEIVTQIPVSDPNGYTDLSVRHLGVGILANNRFELASVIDNDAMGAIQFVVKNNGTKTSEAWTYELQLPNGLTYSSDEQTPLKPNERAVLTVGFGASEITGVKSFSASIATDRDIDDTNNEFAWSVEFVE